jgi:hypothetical protein
VDNALRYSEKRKDHMETKQQRFDRFFTAVLIDLRRRLKEDAAPRGYVNDCGTDFQPLWRDDNAGWTR